MKKTRLIVLALVGFMAAPLHADFFGPANGRTANMDNMSDMSVEVGINLKSNFNTFGGRFNYKISPDVVVFADVGQSNWFGSSSLTYGLGAYYQLRNVTLLENTDFAVKGSYHGGSFDVCDAFFDFGGCSVSASELAIEGLISGDQLATTDFAWYANLGLHIIDVGVSDTNFGLGGGIVGDAGPGQWYAGIDIIDQFFLVGGYRYNIQ